MSDEMKTAPRCPYCGSDMRDENSVGCIDNPRYWYRCANARCGSISPAKSTRWNAYRTAMTRHEMPNRVLTLGEAQNAYYHTDNPIPCELLYYQSACHQLAWIADAVTSYDELSKDMQEVIENEEKVKNVDDLNGAYIQWRECLDWENYGLTWRCWLRKPSRMEMRETPWEEC